MNNKTIIDQEVLTGERALFNRQNLEITNTIFDDGESPLKECSEIDLKSSMF